MLLAFSTVAAAQTRYIKPTAEIPMRSGQGRDYKILAIVADGDAVTMLEEDDAWAKVVTEGGIDGWILKRYLSKEEPLESLVTTLKDKNKEMLQQIEDLRERNEELQTSNNALKETLANNREQLDSAAAKYNELVNETADVISIKKNLTKSRQELTRLQQQLGSVTSENKRLKASRNIKWFLAGGGTLIAGCIIGALTRKSKKRRSSLY
jgi:SH3 domain protein